MRIMVIIGLAILLNVTAFLAPLADLTGTNLSLVDLAIESMAVDANTEWSLLKTSLDGEQAVVELFEDARAPGQKWSLLALSGEVPTERHRIIYRKEHPSEEIGLIHIRQGIIGRTLTVFEENETHTVYTFEVDPKRVPAKMALTGKVTGKLILNRNQLSIERVELLCIKDSAKRENAV